MVFERVCDHCDQGRINDSSELDYQHLRMKRTSAILYFQNVLILTPLRLKRHVWILYKCDFIVPMTFKVICAFHSRFSSDHIPHKKLNDKTRKIQSGISSDDKINVNLSRPSLCPYDI